MTIKKDETETGYALAETLEKLYAGTGRKSITLNAEDRARMGGAVNQYRFDRQVFEWRQ